MKIIHLFMNSKSKVLMRILLGFCCVLAFITNLQAGVEEYEVIHLSNNSRNNRAPQISNGQVTWYGRSYYYPNYTRVYFYDGAQTIILANNAGPYAISNGQVVWGHKGHIYLHDYDAMQTTLVSIGYSSNYNAQISNGQVTWAGWDGNGREIYLYDGTETIQLTDITTVNNQLRPQISNGQVTWAASDGNDSEIYLYDGTQIIQLTDNTYDDKYPQISNGQVTWYGYDGNDYEIYLYDGTQTIQLTDNTTGDYGPQISNGQVAWLAAEPYDHTLYLYDGTQIINIASSNYYISDPDINNGQIVWRGYDDPLHGYDYEIYLYDGTETIQLTDNNYYEYEPQISNGQVTWTGRVAGDYEIFLARPRSLATSFSLVEQSFTTETLTETILAQEILFGDVQVRGDLSGTLSFTEFEIVKITTGPFADKGFFTAQWEAVLDQETYNGTYQGVVYPDPEDREIHLKGNISGDLSGIVEGTLTESDPESGIYDTYHAGWRLNLIQEIRVSSILNLEGPVFYGNDVTFISDIYLYQADMQGDAHGYYVGPLSAVLTHLRLNNTPGEYGEYENKGFSIISYATEYASGEGWAYNSSSLPDIEEFEGLLKEPLLGAVSASLDEEATPKILTGKIEGINLTLYVTNLRVNVWGPQRLSPGQTFNYTIEYGNDGPKDATEAIIYFNLDPYANYISASEGAYYDSYLHQVSWNIGALPAKSSGFLTVQAIIPWGLSNGLSLKSRAIITDIVLHSTEENGCLNGILYNSENDNINSMYEKFNSFNNCTWYPLYDRTNHITGPLEAYLASLDVHTSRNGVGVYDEGTPGIEVTGYRPKWIGYSGGTTTLVNQAKNGRISGEVLYLISPQRVTQSDLQIAKQHFNKIVVYQGDDLIPNAINFYGIVLEPDEFHLTRDDIIDLSQVVLQPPDNNVEDLLSTIESGDGKTIASLDFYNQVPGNKIEINWTDGTSKYFIITDSITAEDGIETLILDGIEHGDWIYVLTEYLEDNEGVLPEGVDIEKLKETLKEYLEESSSEVPQTITVASDPNEKFVSPEGDILSGELLNYTITYENEGEGTAYGVYVTDTLDEDLNDETLLLNGGVGEYDPETRTITWLVGQVGPGETGAFTFQIGAKDDLPENTEVLNFATVYFPSVPEVTRTNGVVSIVNLDTTPPIITVPSNIIIEAVVPIGAMVNYTVTVTDNVDPSPSVNCSPDSGVIFPMGTTTVACMAADASGNQSSASFTVTVQDTTPPVLSGVPSDLTVEAIEPEGIIVDYDLPTGSDIVDGPVAVSCLPASGSVFGFGATSVTCSASDSSNNTSSAGFTINVIPAPLSWFESKKIEVEWDKGKIKVHGNLALPVGKSHFDVSPQGTVAIDISTLGRVVNQAVVFDVRGEEGKKWEFKDQSDSGVSKFKIDWEGARFDYDQAIKIKAEHIGQDSTTLEIDLKGNSGSITITIEDVSIGIDDLGAVSVTPGTIEIDVDDDGEIEVELPFALSPGMIINISGVVSDTITVGGSDYYTTATGKFEVKAHFDPGGFNGDLRPATLSLGITLGEVGYPGSFQINEGDWKKLKDKEWKHKKE